MAVLTTTSAKIAAWIRWLDKCRNGPYANPTFFGKTVGGVAVPWVEPLRALETVLLATRYTPRSAWAYNFRGISGRHCSCSNYGNCSLHGVGGIAIDIDPAENPYKATTIFRWSDTKFTPEQITHIEAIRNTKGEQLWFWGGRWKSIKDYMHFEANVDPGSTVVDWSTVHGNNKIGVFTMLAPCRIGDEGDHVRGLQTMLTACGFDAGGIDGKYGPKTSSALLALRKSLKSSATSGDVFDHYAYEQVHQRHILRIAEIFKIGQGSGGGGAHPDSDHKGLATKAELQSLGTAFTSHVGSKQTGPHA